ncbi:MAG: DUF11 domain-containing protein [Anaerolineae bacterium]|nr:DUF11 domain-containing protein [Anaerolineae bacterium]
MTAEKQQARGRWLFVVVSLALIAIAVLALQGHVTAGAAERGAAERGAAERGAAERGAAERGAAERGAAISPLAASSLPALAPGEAPYTAVSTTTLPYVVRNLSVARLVIDKVVLPVSLIAGPGQIVTYTVTISNAGGGAGTLLSIVDTLPDGFQFDSMVPGGDVTTPPDAITGTMTWAGSWSMAPGDEISLSYRVTASAVPGAYTNQAYVTASEALVPAEPAQATITIQPAVLLQETFNTGINAWTPFLNHHRLEPGQWYYGPTDGTNGSGALTHDCHTGTLIASDGLMMYLQPGAEQWTDYRVEANMYLTGGMSKEGVPQPEQGDPIGFWIRGMYQESELESQWVSGYYVVIVGQSNSENHYVRIAKMQQPGDCEACLKPYRMYNFDNPMEKARSENIPGPFEHYRWYHLAVEVRGANIKVFLDNDLVLDWTDPLLPFLNGTIGFKTHETQIASFDDVTVVPLE